ncbi:TadE family protein [Micromonospora sp. NPDC049900]|uniref:TadE family protein n=1 Tax=Micromonospora sp. NPDC049900 TaxID=3364275 RepID=UPI0037B34809
MVLSSGARRPPRARWPARLRRRLHSERERGSSPVEFVIVAAPMLLLGFGGFQVGIVYYANSIALAAATQGVNVERGYNAPPGSGADHANNFLTSAGMGLSHSQVSVTRTTTDVRVTVTGNSISLLPGMTFSISRTAHGSIERVTDPSP